MKILKVGVILMTLLFGFNSCKKEDMSQYVKKEDLKETTIENIDLEIQPFQWNWNSSSKRWEYTFTHSYINSGILSGYLLDADGKQEMPYYNANTGITCSILDNSLSSKILITYYDGTSSIQAPQYNTYVYLKIITQP